MTSSFDTPKKISQKVADWELDFYSRPILENDGKKRWELLISSTENFSGEETFRWEKKCPANEVNSIWLNTALVEAMKEAQSKGWEVPKRLRCWRSSMKTMIKKASEKIGIEVIESRRTYSLLEWMNQREKDIYPNEPGYISGPIAPDSSYTQISNQPEPLPEPLRGDAWSFSSLPIGSLREADQWPMEFNSLIHIKESLNENISIPGLRLFSKTRALALSAWLSGIEPVKLLVQNNQLVLEAGQQERWLVTDMDKQYAEKVNLCLQKGKEDGDGIQFISIQKSPEDEKFFGFWMLKDLI
ncbi:Tab2/Atab2 family RNA-binding protein [Prochlorococcus marinus]|uniref:Tab2/Atab2 family RNA-binding protein n=1 Tax=Prochlorococcus marinus TaxID=1219 RepID=UPI0022B572B0|nr:Tab2/Atab2 family RNA-binding protein [Prochlorococcus marinus]